MSINLSTFWTTWGVFSGNTSSTNQYDFWRGLIMSNGDQPIPTPTPTATATATPTPTPTATPTPTPTPPAPPVSTGLVGWYVGSDVELTGGVVSTWPDNSGNNNDLVQATSASRPFLSSHLQRYLITFAVQTAMSPFLRMVADSIASMHSMSPCL